jgi:pilus assembly protein CpaF
MYAEIKDTIHTDVIRDVDPKLLVGGSGVSDRMRVIVTDMVTARVNEESAIAAGDRERVVQDLVNDILGYGPITDLLEDADITEVMVNGSNKVYYEVGGKIHKSDVLFNDDKHVMRVIERIISPIGRRIDESVPMVDARLPDGSRVNCIIPPLSLVGPCITVRKFSKDPFTIDDLINFETMTEPMAALFDACVKARLNIIVSGGTGSGKTTTLNVLSSFIPAEERIITIEDAAELQLKQEHVVTLESRPPNIEGSGEITTRDLVKNCLRMRPDRIVVGEVRSGEALDMLQAMNTGHDGSITTCHANSPRDALARIETMVLMAGMDLPSRAIREQMASAVHLIIQQSRLRDGSRKVTHITEVVGMEGNTITMQDIFKFTQTGVDEEGKVIGEFEPTGIVPKFIEEIDAEGIPISREIFYPRELRSSLK